jgi:arsenite methyltransferase
MDMSIDHRVPVEDLAPRTYDRRRIAGKYGIDAPYVPLLSALLGAVALVGAVLAPTTASMTWRLALAVILFSQALVFLHMTVRGKFMVWERLFDQVSLDGDELVLDIGCGRGMVLITAARRLTTGRATGIDLWRAGDQSGNDPVATRVNAHANRVADRIDLQSVDMTRMQLPSATFDVVTANVAIRTVKDRVKRRAAIEEIYRVTRPGGTILLVDTQHVLEYRDDLVACGAEDVNLSGLGPSGWFGNPYVASRLVSATKP